MIAYIPRIAAFIYIVKNIHIKIFVYLNFNNINS